ncbi:acetoacetate--CoA ligase [Nocardia takedensis]
MTLRAEDTVGVDDTDAPAEAVWAPSVDVRARTGIGRYLRWLRARRGLEFGTYQDLWRWSVAELPGFWASIWEFFDLEALGSHSAPTGPAVSVRAVDSARWFQGATFNYAEAVLRMPGLGEDDLAVHAVSQTRPETRLTVAQLRDRVGAAQAGLIELGVGCGDRVAGYLPNIPEALVLMLAVTGLGAVFTSSPPEFGSGAVLDRLDQIAPKVLVAVDGYRYGDKRVDRRADVDRIVAGLPGLDHLVHLPYLDADSRGPAGAVSWAALTARPAAPVFAPVPFDHPLYVLFSSGTTGPPKPIVHGHGGITVEHLKLLALHLDLGRGDRFFWFTTTGWMMWNLLVSGLAVGSAVVLFDGDPGHRSLATLWDVVARTATTWFGASAPFLMACRAQRLRPGWDRDLSALRGLGSTGAPLPEQGYEWVREQFAGRVYFTSVSGGTDLCTAFLGDTPLMAVLPGRMSCRMLGAAVEALDEQSRSVLDRRGELVLSRPMPSMPVGFWNDTDRSRYRAAYFEDIPGFWRHGDWVTIDGEGRARITGRSDATLNRGGVRLGSAEFYTVLESVPGVSDSLVIHLDAEDRLLGFVALTGSTRLDDALRTRIAAALRERLSPRHTPDELYQVTAIPRTVSGKKLEIPIKRLLCGAAPEEVVGAGVTADPRVLDQYVSIRAARATARDRTPATIAARRPGR